MTEAEWLESNDPQTILEFLQHKASDRKLRLFAVACCRQVWQFFPYESGRKVVAVAEQYAEGLASPQTLANAQDSANQDILRAYDTVDEYEFPKMVCEVVADSAFFAAVNVDLWAEMVTTGSSRHADLLRDILGNPFRSARIEADWLTLTVISLAQAAYDERALAVGTMDCDRLSILADALEDSGCTDATILDHLRGPGPHVRGCFVIDALLGKE